MASYLDREKIPVAVTESSKFDLSHVHITTADFMQLAPIMTKEMVPGEKLDVQVNTFSRMDTLPVPTYGRCSIKNRGFFVPYRTIFRGWTDFITDAPHANSMNNVELVGNILTTVPTVTNRVLCQAFVDASVVYDVMGSNTSTRPVDVVATAADADIIYVDASSNSKYYQLNALGRHLLKVVESLGYKINWKYSDNTVYSALPLLAYAKVYCDWYFPSAYTNTDIYNYLLLLCNSDTGQPQALNKVDVARILQFSYVCYDSDYFVSAWDNPVAPNSNNFSTMKLLDITTAHSAAGSATGDIGAGDGVYRFGTNNYVDNYAIDNSATTNGTPISVMAYGSAANNLNYSRVGMTISDYQHKALSALTDYFKRHQLAGSRALDRYLARFGKALSSEKMNRSIYLGSQIIPVQIGDVMSNSLVGQAGFDGLGEYAGKGIAYGQDGNFSYSTDEYGIFIMVSSIVPATGYYQGIDRNVKHVAKSDFFTPEFDGLGVQAITADELYVSKFGDASLASTDIHDHVFGFTPRYAEYKMKNDKVTGNFRVNHLNGNSLGSASWHLMREFDDSDFDASVANVNHGVNFVYSRGDMGQYNRIFAYQTDTLSDWLAGSDPFVLIHEFNVGSYAPMKPLYDTYEFDDADKGRKVNLDVNGVKMN